MSFGPAAWIASCALLFSPAGLLARNKTAAIDAYCDTLRSTFADNVALYLTTIVNGAGWQSGSPQLMDEGSLEQLVQEIQDSGCTAIAADEIKACLNILGREMPSDWCSVYGGDGGSLNVVTLQGEGWKKEEIKSWCEQEIAKMNK